MNLIDCLKDFRDEPTRFKKNSKTGKMIRNKKLLCPLQSIKYVVTGSKSKSGAERNIGMAISDRITDFLFQDLVN